MLILIVIQNYERYEANPESQMKLEGRRLVATIKVTKIAAN